MSRTQRRSALTATMLLAAAAALTACASNSGSAEGGADPVGTWGDATMTSGPSLVLDEGGEFSGTDGCNRLSGAWSEQDQVISFESVTSTMMACEGVDTWLSELSSARISDDTMTVYAEANAEIGTLQRTE